MVPRLRAGKHRPKISQYPPAKPFFFSNACHTQYILYFVGPGVSMICAIALNIVSISSIKSVRGDRSMCVINVALMAACVVYNTLKQGVIPWSGGKASGGPKSANLGFASYCNLYNDKTTQLRCCMFIAVFI